MTAAVSETRIVSLILARLHRLKEQGYPVHFWRANTGRATVQGGRTISFGEPGQADVLGVANGAFIAIETKSEAGRQSKKQRDWQVTIEQAGGVYVLARDADTALAPVLVAIGVRLTWNKDHWIPA